MYLSNVQTSSYSSYSNNKSSNMTTTDSNQDSFEEMLKQAQTDTNDSKKTQRKDSTEGLKYKSMSEFFKRANEEGGILQFVQKANAEKIEELVKEKEAELRGQYGLNKEPPLSGKALQDATKAVSDALEEFKKELVKKLADKKAHNLEN